MRYFRITTLMGDIPVSRSPVFSADENGLQYLEVITTETVNNWNPHRKTLVEWFELTDTQTFVPSNPDQMESLNNER